MAVFDIEADDLYENVTKIHCLAYTRNGEEPTVLYDYDEMRDFLTNSKWLCAHNGIRYDKRVLEKLLGITISAKFYDTLPLAWYLDHDQLKHGLEVYGDKYGIPKPVINNWKDLTHEEYGHRCSEDVKINWKLWVDLTKRLKLLYKDKQEADRFMRYLSFKMECAAYQEDVGVKLGVDLVRKCIDTLTQQQEEKVTELAKAMPPRKIYKMQERPKNLFKKDGTPSSHGQRWFDLLDQCGLDRTHDEPVRVHVKDEEANPKSSDQVKDWLFSLGWKPCTFDYKKNEDGTERAVPQVRDDGELTESVKLLIDDNPAVAILDGLTVIQHRLSIFEGFLEKAVKKDDGWYVKAEIGGLTNTLRFKHSKPLVNLPGVDKPWGKEIRGALIAPEGYEICGADMVSLEATTKKHYMFLHDPDYVAEMSVPGFDEHLDLAKFAGKVSAEDVQLYVQHKDDHDLGDNLAAIVKAVGKVRKSFKPVNYSAVYGVGKVKLARTTGMPESQCQELLDAYWDRNWAVREVAEEQTVRTLGGQMWLYNPVSRFWISLRYKKDIFSSLNQSTGVFCFDSWLMQCVRRGLRPIFQFHDEGGWYIQDRQATLTKMNDAIAEVNNTLNLNVPLGIDAKFGSSYSEVH